ncbi:MAG: hypothetical protein COX62_05100 [Deltaproteobacteria bacterium CG_4_10_14_0_2_um_filter_43_8]|nr:MAG: hypothetical protein COV43_09555 [Deltaproteobacteria bacterium CG11_big_fil_rev_8_21_14_0_20_42_23]PJA20197.1 MAG: hypothetical protein COX62_05100 [Deltaproteobacteria bacterium CG_4_10_14_0_2_um_filter_43_8]PJC64336.1 MAG: hypothetical protein CO021_04850 [Deltaproteobacteria bacterium CG_4_9_14_0_2_um_filter_42_21]
MKKITPFFLFASFSFFFLAPAFSFSSLAQDDEEVQQESLDQENQEQEPTDDDEASNTDEETSSNEDDQQDEEETDEETAEAKPEADKEATEESARRRNVVIDSVVTLNYVFENSANSFLNKYHIHLEGIATGSTAVIKGEATITCEAEGFLAKWPGGECKLTCSIPKVPYEMAFRQTGEDKGSIALRWKTNIFETWKSECTFKEANSKPFVTTGSPELWLAKALKQARPPLGAIALKLENDQETTSTFVINKTELADPPIGNAELEGTGVITIKPPEE